MGRKIPDDFLAQMKEIVNEWNIMAETVNIPQVYKLTENRKAKLATRIDDSFFRENWRRAIWEIPKQKFLLGFNMRGWVVNFDWFIKSENNFVSILEGKYTQKFGRRGRPNKLEFDGESTEDFDEKPIDERLRTFGAEFKPEDIPDDESPF